MDKLDVRQLKQLLQKVARLIIESEPYLTEIDTVIGDGDHGTGMKRGFTAVQKMLSESEFQTIDALVRAVGMELIKTMGGASGVIFGTMFIGGLSQVAGKESATVADLARYFDAGEQAIEKRGKAKAGDKTMLDALIPAAAALKAAAELEGASVERAFADAYDAALGGVEASKAMISRTGRSKNFREATIGLPDPGAVSVSLIFQALRDGVAS